MFKNVSYVDTNDRQRPTSDSTDSLLLRDLTLVIGGHELLSGATLQLESGRRYGVVGKNGIGKSTLLRHIHAHTLPRMNPDIRTAIVEQDKVFSEADLQLTVQQYLLQHDSTAAELQQLEQKLDSSSSDKIDQSLIDQLEAATLQHESQDDAIERVHSITKDLQLPTSYHSKKLSELSGGWQMRVQIAAALLQEPDILLLDEPTSHLDLQFILYFAHYLTTQINDSMIIVCVSHDRSFLTSISTDTIHYHSQQLSYYRGDFESFVNSRENQLSNLSRQQAALDKKRAHIVASIGKIKASDKRAGKSEVSSGLVASRQKKLGRMGLEKTMDGKKFVAQEHGIRLGSANSSSLADRQKGRQALSILEPPDKDFRFVFPQPLWVTGGFNRQDTVVATLNHVSYSYTPKGERPLFEHIELTIRGNDKIGILGENGRGKSSLLKLLAGVVQPRSGIVDVSSSIRVAYFTQDHVNTLSMSHTPVQHLMANVPSMSSQTEQQIRAVLGRFGLGGHLASVPVSQLSGGQRSRLVFATITSMQPHLLILDEPSNHLDFVTINALLDAIESYEGAVVLVSHDQTLLQACNKYLIVEKQPLVKPKPTSAKAAKSKVTKVTLPEPSSQLTARSRVRPLGVPFEEYIQSMTEQYD